MANERITEDLVDARLRELGGALFMSSGGGEEAAELGLSLR